MSNTTKSSRLLSGFFLNVHAIVLLLTFNGKYI